MGKKSACPQKTKKGAEAATNSRMNVKSVDQIIRDIESYISRGVLKRLVPKKMAWHLKKRSKKAGLPPGTLIHIGTKKPGDVKISLIDYSAKSFEERNIKKIEECFPFKSTPSVTWINISGLHDVSIIEKIGNHFDIHPLVLEDILSTGQRPKVEEFDKYVFVVLNMLLFDEKSNQIIAEQISLIFGKNFVISFQETEGDVFDIIRTRIRTCKGRIRSLGADYLAYSLIDAIVDNYFIILEKFGDNIDLIEERLVTEPDPSTLQTIYNLKREMIFLRKSVWPLRDLVNKLERSDSKLISSKTRIYFRDIYDHSIQIIDTVETFRDMASGMLELHLSSISNRLNEVMKVLTIFSTIFIPLTFIVGVYGMNFRYMPELEWRSGYFILLGVMTAVAVVMLFYFRKKKWF